MPEALSVVLLQAFDPSALSPATAGGDRQRLPYRVETIAEAGITLELTDVMYRGVWQWRPVRRIVWTLEQLVAPFLQTLLMARSIGTSDATIAMFERQASAMAVLRRLRVPPFTRPRLVVISCWLAQDLEHFGPLRRALYRFSYRSVDRVVFFSANQSEIFERELALPPEKLCSVPFGVDDDFFTPSVSDRSDYVLAVGRDPGRDWSTFFAAVRDLDVPVKVACQPATIEHLDLPPNVEVVGFVDEARYRELLAGARVVVVATKALNYPTGQSVMLEAMAMGKCCIVTATAALADYVVDGETGLLVPPADTPSLRAAIERACTDAALRRSIGSRARERVEREFNAGLMWRRIGTMVREICGGSR